METEGHGGELAAELTRLSGRVELLVAHLASGSVRRRIGVDDLAQDVLLRVLSSEAAVDLRGEELWAYIHTVARHTVIDAARRLRHAPRRSASMAQNASVGSSARQSVISARSHAGPGPGTLAADAEGHARLLAAFDALSPEYRRVIGLRRFEGLTAADAARRMGRSETAVHSLFRRALAAWSEALEGPAGG